MAVEARHRNHFLPQIFSSRELAMNNNIIIQPSGVHMSSNTTPAMAYGTSTTTAPINPTMYGFSIKTTAEMKSDNGVTYVANINTRKRPRDYNCTTATSSNDLVFSSYNTSSPLFGEDDLALQIHQQQLDDVNRFVSQHTEKLRIEIEQRRNQYSKQISHAMMQHAIAKKLKSKEEELINICKLNIALEEKIKSLSMENQLLRDVAQTNEAAADALRRNLEQALAEQQERRRHASHDLLPSSSSCGSSNYYDERRTLADTASTSHGECANGSSGNNRNMIRMCKRCEREESCVLLLPCRHLCLCTACGSSVHVCPSCNGIKTASVHVNIC